ncbi:HEAT repeat domain-containing protein [Nocardia sp. NBC_01730]|uniref:HEAT repeat domain-containing protein n=1 Tax=Nocardia sp. NBC_01730 TaxID=2975998 RepID=UPI002E1459B5|nr:HEAT repeat domain-containing protein [Nocardia sp. NBC_01730]
MTPEDEKVILGLVYNPSSQTRVGSADEVLRHFGTSDGCELGLTLLKEAAEDRDADGVELALIVSSEFGITTDYLDILVRLSSAEWHYMHEAVVSRLGQLRTSAAVDALYRATTWIPDYLDYDENRALATKAIWALGDTPGPEAEAALVRLRDSDSQIVRQGAEAQIERRQESHNAT